MKKTYIKPEIQIEKFEMDIAMLEMVLPGSKLYDDLKKYYDTVMVPQGAPKDDAVFDAWVKSMGYDTPTSGLCYFTPTQPS